MVYLDSLSASAAGPRAGDVLDNGTDCGLSNLQQQKIMTARITMQMEQTVRALPMAVAVRNHSSRENASTARDRFCAYSCCVCVGVCTCV